MIQEIFDRAAQTADRRTKALTALQAQWPAFIAKVAESIKAMGYSSVLVTTDSMPFKSCKVVEMEDGQSNYGFRVYADGDVCPCKAEITGDWVLSYDSLDPESTSPLRCGIVEAIKATIDLIEKLEQKAEKQSVEAEVLLNAL